MLLSFGDAIARSKRSPEKLFVLLDMYEIMRELHSEVWLMLHMFQECVMFTSCKIVLFRINEIRNHYV